MTVVVIWASGKGDKFGAITAIKLSANAVYLDLYRDKKCVHQIPRQMAITVEIQ